MLNFFTHDFMSYDWAHTQKWRGFPFFRIGGGEGGATDDLSVEYIVLKPNIVTQIINWGLPDFQSVK